MTRLTIALGALDLLALDLELTPAQLAHWRSAVDALEEAITLLSEPSSGRPH